MSKLTLLAIALIVARAAAQSTQATGGGGGGGCSADDANFVGTQPQNKGKKCADHSPDNCKFLDEAIKACCATCSTRQNETPAPNKPNNNPAKPGKKKGCFHGDDMVNTKEYGTISMSQLSEKRDAHVLTRNDDGHLEYSSVRYWLHAQPSINMKFYILSTESGHRLSLTGDHLIYETDCQGNDGHAIYAKNVEVGRCLLVNNNGELKETRVVEKGQEKMSGIYSPITTTGSIVVNDVLASCFNYYENEALQKFAYHYLIGVQDMLAEWMPTSLYQAAFNNQNGAFVGVPRIILNFLQLHTALVH